MARRLLAQALLAAAWANAQDVDHQGCIHMQVIHSTNKQYFAKRAVQFDLANRSDVAYYAKRTSELLSMAPEAVLWGFRGQISCAVAVALVGVRADS